MSSENLDFLFENFKKASTLKEKVEVLKQIASHYQNDSALEFLFSISFDKKNPGLAYQAKKILNQLRKNLKSQGIDIDSKLKSLLLQVELKRLKDDDYKIRIDAVQNISKGKSDKVFKILVEMLQQEEHSYVIATLVKALARTGGSKAINYIKDYLKSEDDRIRANTVEALEIIEVKEAVELIKTVIFDESPRVKANAAKALWKYSKLESLELFRKILKDGDKKEKLSAIFALSQIPSMDTRNLLALMMNDSDIEIRLQASIAISKLDEKIRAIIEKEGELKEVSIKFSTSTSSLDDKKATASVSSSSSKKIDFWQEFINASDYNQKVVYLQKIAANYQEYSSKFTDLVEYIQKEDNKFVISAAVKTLGCLNYEGKYTSQFLSICQNFFLKHPDDRVRANTIEALSDFVNPETVKLIIPLIGDSSNRVKANAMKLLWEFDKNEAKTQIIKMIKEGDQFQLSSALFLLEGLEGEEADKLREEVDILLQEKDIKQKTSYSQREKRRARIDDAISLDIFEPENVLLKQLEILSDKNAPRERRIKSAIFIGFLGETEEIYQRVVDILQKEADNFVKATLVKTVAQLGGENAIPILAPFLRDPDSRIRANTVEAFDFIISDKINKYIEMALYDLDNRVQANAIKVLWNRDRDKAKERLKKMAHSPESWVRRSAVYILSCVCESDEEAYNLLLQFANDPDIEVALYAGEVIENINQKLEARLSSRKEPQFLDLGEFSSTFLVTNFKEIIDEIFYFLENEKHGLKEKLLSNLKKLLKLDVDFSYLEEKLHLVENKFLLATLVKVIGSCKKKEAIDLLVPFLEDEDSRVRANTIEALSFVPDTLKYRYFYKFLEDEDTRVFCVALSVLWKTFPQDCLEKLNERIAKGDIFLLDRLKYVFSRLEDELAVKIFSRIKDLTSFEELQQIDWNRLVEEETVEKKNDLVKDKETNVQDPSSEDEEEKEKSNDNLLGTSLVLESELEEDDDADKMEGQVETQVNYEEKEDKKDKKISTKIKKKKSKKSSSKILSTTTRNSMSPSSSKSVEKKSQSFSLRKVVAILILLVILGGYWYFFQKKEENSVQIKLPEEKLANKEREERKKREKLKKEARKQLDVIKALYGEKDYKKVISILKNYLKKYPQFYKDEVNFYLGLSLLKLKKYKLAKKYFLKAKSFSKDGSPLIVRVEKLILYLEGKKRNFKESGSKEVVDKVKNDKVKIVSQQENTSLKSDKKRNKVKNEKSVWKPIPIPKPIIIPFVSKYRDKVEKAQQYFMDGENQKCESLLLEVLKKEPKNPEANLQLGLFYFSVEKFDKSLKYLLKALPYKSKDGDIYLTIGDILNVKGDYKNAARFFEEGLKYVKDDYMSMLKLGEIYNKLGKTQKAREILSKIPDDYSIEVVYQFAISYLKENNKVKAAFYFKQLKEKFPNKIYGYVGLGRIYYLNKEYLDAIKILKKGLEIDHSNFKLKKYLLLTYLATHQLGKVFALDKDIANGKTNDPDLLVAFAREYVRSKDFSAARIFLEKGLDLYPQNFAFYEIKGDILKLNNNVDEALIYYKKALKLAKDKKDKIRIKKKISS